LVDIEDLLRELGEAAQVLHPLNVENGEFTIKMFMDANGVSRNVALPALKVLERDGIIEYAGERCYNGKRCKAWHKVA